MRSIIKEQILLIGLLTIFSVYALSAQTRAWNTRIQNLTARTGGISTEFGQPVAFSNPAYDVINIKLDRFVEGPVDVTIIAADGRIVASFPGLTPTGKEIRNLEISYLPVGAYHCMIEMEGQVFSQRLNKIGG